MTDSLHKKTRFERIGVVGAGAIGGWLAARLALAGRQVSVLARGATRDAVERDGLRLKEADGAELSVPVRVDSDGARLGEQDLVIVAVKAPQMEQAARALVPLLAADTAVLTAMNGVPWWFFQGFGGALSGTGLKSVDPGGAIASIIAPERVIGGVVHASCATEGPGRIRHHFGQGLILGEPSGGVSPRAAALRELMAAAGLDSTASEQIQRDVWYKLWGNMTVNPVSALTRATADRIMDDDALRGFISQVMLEARDIGTRIGLPIEQTPEDRHAVTRRLGAFKTSMLQDVEAGRPIEREALVGAVLEIGQRLGMPTPFTSALYGLTRVMDEARTLRAA